MTPNKCYAYPALFTRRADMQRVDASFPDLNASTSGADEADAIAAARELLFCVLSTSMLENEELPRPTPLSDLELSAGQRVMLIDAGELLKKNQSLFQ